MIPARRRNKANGRATKHDKTCFVRYNVPRAGVVPRVLSNLSVLVNLPPKSPFVVRARITLNRSGSRHVDSWNVIRVLVRARPAKSKSVCRYRDCKSVVWAPSYEQRRRNAAAARMLPKVLTTKLSGCGLVRETNATGSSFPRLFDSNVFRTFVVRGPTIVKVRMPREALCDCKLYRRQEELD